MDGANQRFISGKTNWLATHLMLYNVQATNVNYQFGFANTGNVNTTLPIVDFDLRKGKDIINAGLNTKTYCLHELGEYIRGVGARVTTKHTHAIRAYILPWGTDKTFSGQLGNQAEFFFTPTVNGCTFAYDGVGTNVKVAHANFVQNQLIDQNAIDADLAVKFGHAPAHTLIKATYKTQAEQAATLGGHVTPNGMTEDYRATVIGIRTGNNWNFYYQSYRIGTSGGVVTTTGLGMCVPI